METSIIISGFGGQGALFAGQLLTYAGMDNGHYVTWIPSYGPEMRGGTAHCTVLISDEPIGAPTVARPDIAIVLNGPSFAKYEPLVKPDGLLVVNNAIVNDVSLRNDITAIYVPANSIAEEFGSVKMLNMAAIGAMLSHWQVLSIDDLEHALEDHLPKSKASFLSGNLKVLHRGYDIGKRVKV